MQSAETRALNITPHVAQKDARPGGSALDARTTRQPGYAVSQWIRKRIEEAFGWMKTVGGLRKTPYRGRSGCRCTPIWLAPPTICSELHGCWPLPHETAELIPLVLRSSERKLDRNLLSR